MSANTSTISAPMANTKANPTLYRILFAISLVHLFNDSMQSVIPAIFPILKESMGLSYTQLGLIGFSLSFTASIMQPVVGMYTDARPSPWLLPVGMVSSLLGMLSLAFAANYIFVLLSVVLVGIGSAVFHPEASRVAHMAAGSRRGLAQSIYQVGGNAGQALAPVMTALIFYPLGQHGAIWFTLVAGAAVFVQIFVARWYGTYLRVQSKIKKSVKSIKLTTARKKEITAAIIILIFLVFARSWYGAGISNYYVFYIHETFLIAKENAQYYIFCFLAAGALGTFFGGPISDLIGRRNTIFFSMLGAAPFALMLPYADRTWTFVLLLIIGFINLSSFSVAVVYAQELIPGKIGTVTGLIIGLAFGLGAIGALALGSLIDWLGISTVMKMCSILPMIGLLTILLPSDLKLKAWAAE
jgi:FSR family fosmidomycin resistance protein-like MFS transporter